MRITMNTLYGQINTDLGRLTENMAKTNSSISSGKIYRRPSDAPVALTHALGIRTALSETDQYQKNITYAKGWVSATDSAMQQIQDRLLRAKSLAVQGANDSQSATSRQAIAAEVKTILQEVVALGNSKLGNRYVFAGTKTQGYAAGDAPFTMAKDGVVTYNGNQEALSVDVASGLSQQINLDGHTSLEQTGLFGALDSLYDSLMADSQPGIEAAMGDIDQSLDGVNAQVAKIGATTNSLDTKSEMASSLTLTNQERLSDTEDTDIVKAASDLNTYETSYQAALVAASKVMSLSLADYLTQL